MVHEVKMSRTYISRESLQGVTQVVSHSVRKAFTE